ncbi:hypothetical protein OSB04_026451 [Centaurea solstitialis]|uniref:Uncharacterized protein n=1 Tax=Centaurea solstitialis TaxID=347529 RepID=A0AA38W5W9_9ASTR|nr:hypothetical protein OSB04_026451 [Centaurea solstitialis]
MNTQMQDYMDDLEEDTLSLCDLLIEEDIHLSSKTNSSSSSSSSSEQDFLGFFTEEWVRSSSENIVFCGKIVSSTPVLLADKKQETKTQLNTHPFRSNSDSFRYMRLKTAAKPTTSRSKSLPSSSVSSSSICKSRFLVFMFGSGSSKFPTKIDVSEIKSRQLRRQSTMASPSVNGGGKKESGGRKNGNKGWWRVVDVLGCGGGYKRDTIGVLA